MMKLRNRVAALGITGLLTLGGALFVASPAEAAGWTSHRYGPFSSKTDCLKFRNDGVWGWVGAKETRTGACHTLGQGAAGWYFISHARF